MKKMDLKEAKGEVRKFIMAGKPSHPGDVDNDRDQYIFICPECGNETFFPSEDFNSYACRYCKYHEDMGECSVGIACNSKEIPVSYLSSWNEEEGTSICEYCESHLHSRGQ